MPITLDQIIEEARHWPPEKVGELLNRLTVELRAGDAEIETSWKQEARRRLAEIEKDDTQSVDGELVSARIRQIVGR